MLVLKNDSMWLLRSLMSRSYYNIPYPQVVDDVAKTKSSQAAVDADKEKSTVVSQCRAALESYNDANQLQYNSKRNVQR